VNSADIARGFLAAYAAKDLATIAALISDDALLRDWNLEVQGRAAFLAETQKNFDNAASLEIAIEHLHATATSVAAEVSITVNGSIRLRVVDVFDFDAAGLVSAVRSYKGLDP
jgi:ketosteroid isomerase-like protein